jgi:hypothetical protein
MKIVYNEMEDIITNWEDRITFLTDHIEELESQLQYYQNLLAEKEIQINQLKKDNANFMSQLEVRNSQFSFNTSIQSQPSSLVPPPNLVPPKQRSPPQNLVSPPVIGNPPNEMAPKKAPLASNDDPGSRTRKCPQCGVMGFAIKEVDDKTRILSYTPHRIYAKKRVCTKCRFEF